MELSQMFETLTEELQTRGDWVLVRAQNPELQTKTGIVVQHDHVAAVRWGEVLVVGPKVEGIEPGQMACWPEFTGLMHRANDHTWFLRDEELVAVGDPVLDAAVDLADTPPTEGDVAD